GPSRVGVTAGVPVEISDATMRASFGVIEGRQIGFALHWTAVEDDAPRPTAANNVPARIEDAVEAWRSWEAEHDIYEGPHRELVPELANAAAEGWKQRDAGMWEMRGEPQHHLSSKVFCWTALERAVKLAPKLGRYGARASDWAAERDRIRAEVLERGWSDKRQ